MRNLSSFVESSKKPYVKSAKGDSRYSSSSSSTVTTSPREKLPVFNPDGTVTEAELKIMNFKPNARYSEADGSWEEVGSWSTQKGLDIKDIVWPGGSHVPPDGVPEKFHLKVTFLEEPPFIIMSDPDPISDKCTMNRGVPCYVPEVIKEEG